MNTSMLRIDPPDHTRMRKLAAKANAINLAWDEAMMAARGEG
jgi:hypothetical protein